MTAVPHVNQTNALEIAPHRYAAEASDLGLAPGTFPKQLSTKLGNGFPFVRQRTVTCHGDLSHVEYRQMYGCIELAVFND